MTKAPDIEKYKMALGIAMDALEMYADPESYHAVAFAFDRPCGDFANDFSRTKHPHYNRPMPGKAARGAIRELARKYGGLKYHSRVGVFETYGHAITAALATRSTPDSGEKA